MWFVALVGIVALLAGTTQIPAKAEDSPSVSISLPPDFPSETVQISYFLIGRFGGYGGYAARRTGVHSYEIPTIVEGKAATEIRMIVYSSGCQIQQFAARGTGKTRIERSRTYRELRSCRLIFPWLHEEREEPSHHVNQWEHVPIVFAAELDQ